MTETHRLISGRTSDGSSRPMARAFSLIELMAVMAILALFAAAVVPNLAAQKASRERDAFFSRLANLAVEAREDAIAGHQTTALTASTTGVSIMSEPSQDQTSTNSTQPMGAFGNNTDQVAQNSQSTASTTEQEIKRIDAPSGVDLTSFKQAGANVGQTDWKIQFYSDGTSDGGGVELNEGGRVRSLDISIDGTSRLLDGSLPDHSQDSWPAGTYESRAQQGG